ncbi:biotin--[acetyl-CoA-carboxylase] ligase [Puia sp.]|uniref:biotin--[acetyl-CoA-carboxylase] ligase n=1 Tax=Puia sp. TaxID=2045100 RepID=UPI002F412B6F
MPIGHSFIELESVDSTNNYAMARAAAGAAPHGTLVFAHDQWAGKGQRGRRWMSTPGENIILTAVLEPVALPPTAGFSLSVAVALACRDLFSHYAGQEPTTIKWPNDLYWNDRKAGGILIENHFKGDRWLFAIAGMGININQVEFPPEARNPVSLRQITGKSFDSLQLARSLGAFLDKRYTELETGGAITQLQQYNDHLFGRGRDVRLKKENAVFKTVVKEVTPHGQLLTKDVIDRQFTFGEVEWLIEPPSRP